MVLIVLFPCYLLQLLFTFSFGIIHYRFSYFAIVVHCGQLILYHHIVVVYVPGHWSAW